MIYPADFEIKIGFDRIRSMLSSRCISPLGLQKIEQVSMHTRFEIIELLLGQTEEIRQIILQNLPFPQSNYLDMTEALQRIKPLETFLEPDELLDLKVSYETIIAIKAFLEQRHSNGELKFPALASITTMLEVYPNVIKDIDRLIDDKGTVRTSASPNLASIRQKQHRLESESARKIVQLFQQAKNQGLVENDVELTLRNGRQVIPMPVAHKRRIKGIIHDQSASGQTVYLEPEEVFELNNEIRELELEERREIIRVLKAFCEKIRPFVPCMLEGYELMGIIDSTRAKALLALAMNAQKPKLVDKPSIKWIKAIHPLLYFAHQTQNKHVEPMSISLGEDNRILVISGPNAGGKSVCLKTCGLLQYMVQCGLLVPMEDYSEAGIFERLYIDIGDQQSLENDLSTYSSHLHNMAFFLKNCNHSTLFLIDEFGAGTEPRIGGAIAEAILENLNKSGALGVVTTHYANLKLMAGKHAGISNGSMLFDTRNMRPLFKLKTGNPGSSFAFDIARSIGLPDEVLGRAGEYAGVYDLDFDRQLHDLDLKKTELEEKEKQLLITEQFLTEVLDKYQKLYGEIEGRKGAILTQARTEAKKIVAEANRTIENTIRKIKEARAEKIATKDARHELEVFAESLESPTPQASDKSKNLIEQDSIIDIETGPLSIGDAVRVEGQSSIGEVLEITGTQAVVRFGNIRLKTGAANLMKVKKSLLTGSERTGVKVKMAFDINEKATSFNPVIDIIGLRAEEAITKLRRVIDDALLLGIKELKVTHGKGEGILREAVRSVLQTIPEVRNFRDEHVERGGTGATIIELE
ncbi:MAG TPA: Smr/MutS family protein [Bacteroidales bacterium]|nr:Smr/MutS family protein [Bacteroidales bacterium]